MSAPKAGRVEVGPRTEAFVAWLLAHGKVLWIAAILLAIPAAARTASLYIHLRSELDQLLPRESPSVLAIGELRERMPGLQYLGVLVEATDKSALPQGEKLLDDLAARVRAYPPELVRTARTGVGEERQFIEDHAVLFMDLPDVRTIRARIEARRDYEAARALGTSLDDDEPPPSIDFSDIEARYRDRDPTKGRFPQGRFSDVEKGTTLLLIEVGGFSTGADRGKRLMERVKADIADLGGPERYSPSLRVGYTGDVAISVEEMTGLIADLSLSSALVLIAVIAVILAYFRWWQSIPALLLPLLVGAVITFAGVTLPPFRITELNSNTAFMGSIIVGNGINTAIILLARYREERHRGEGAQRALGLAIAGTRVATFSAALAAGVAYGSLVATQFRGFRQFGVIGGIGMLLCWGAAYVLMPPLVAWLDDGPPPARTEGNGVMAPLARAVSRWPVAIVALAIVATTASIYKVSGFRLSQIEHDFSRLRRASTWVEGEGFWGRKMDALLGRYLSPTVVLSDDPKQARAIAASLKAASREGGALADRVASVRTIDDVLPLDQEEKLAELAAVKRMRTPRLLAKVPEDKRRHVDRLLSDKAMMRVGAADLPAAMTTGMREKNGAYDRVVLIFPKPSKVLWQGPPLIAYVDELRRVAAEHPFAGRAPRIAGSHPLTADILRAVERDGPIAAGAALAGVIAVIVVMFRGSTSTVFALGALIAGVLWFLGLTLSIGVRANFTNFIALPITLGIGVDYGVNVMARYQLDGKRDVGAAIRATGAAVGLCSATTIIGYSSLLVADNRALFSFGLTAVLGEIACLVCAVSALPAALVLFDRARAAGKRASSTAAVDA